jgi:hypothetical protein
MRSLLNICSTIIVCISGIDIYWLSKNRDYIVTLEENPLGKYLLNVDNGDVSLFILCKFLGTYIVIATLYYLKNNQIKYVPTIAITLAITQIFLLFYLYYAPDI